MHIYTSYIHHIYTIYTPNTPLNTLYTPYIHLHTPLHGRYAKTLRKTLDDAGFSNTKLVAKDGGADICDDLSKVSRAGHATQ